MNKFSLVSMALSVLFCSFANATDQSVPSVPQSDTKTDATTPVDNSAQTVKTDSAQTVEETTQSVTRKPAVSKSKVTKKRRKAKACLKTNRIEQTNEFTKKLNNGEEVVTDPAKVQQQQTTPTTPSTDTSVKA